MSTSRYPRVSTVLVVLSRPHSFYSQMHANGTFTWDITYVRRHLEKGFDLRSGQPFPQAVMSGGLFAVTKERWLELEGYDPGQRPAAWQNRGLGQFSRKSKMSWKHSTPDNEAWEAVSEIQIYCRTDSQFSVSFKFT